MNLGSNRWRFLAVCIFMQFAAAAMLYALQHGGQLSGGAIAPSKLAWLFVVIVFWYVLPIYWLMDRSIDKEAKLVLQLFLASMITRAVVELTMMYITKSWLHAYGIAHSAFSVVLCTIGAMVIYRPQRQISLFLIYCSVLFVIEIYFAQYLRVVSRGDGNVFFLESAPEHAQILLLTRLAVIISIAVFLFLIMRQARGSFKR